jgi:hypothetical protein
MEETSRGWRPPLKIERAFAGSRLEQQILVRAYELAAPIIRKRLEAGPSPEPFDRSVDVSLQSQPVAKGA